MITAREIVRALGDRNGSARCPTYDDINPFLTIGKTHFALGTAYAVACAGRFLHWETPRAQCQPQAPAQPPPSRRRRGRRFIPPPRGRRMIPPFLTRNGRPAANRTAANSSFYRPLSKRIEYD